ncbi:MAG: acetyltransferase [Desulfobacterales bacterium SG8_35_2]|nr:MAG: acetyltransferase [Desulfobacterales bacterium SG8_35_2]
MSGIFIHETAIVSPKAEIGINSKIWVNVQIRENATIGSNCIIGKDVYIDHGVTIGDNCKIQNHVSIYHGVHIEDDVFVGPNVSFTNDKYPRAFNNDWEIVPIYVRKGASIGANSTIVCGVEIGEYAMVAAGSIVTKDVAPYSLVMGTPAKHEGYVNKMGHRK